MTTSRYPLLVMGLGNILWSDDGLGIAAVNRLLGAFEPPAGVRVLDGGTLGLTLLPIIQDAERAILIDAIRAPGAEPGTLVRIEGEEVAPAVRERLSPHQIGVSDLLDAARLLDCYPTELVLLGIAPERLGFGISLSAAVRRPLDALVNRVVAQARQWGFAFSRRAGGDGIARSDGDGTAADKLCE